MHQQISQPPSQCYRCASSSSSAFFLVSGAWDLPSGLCRSSWLAPFEAFHSCFAPQDLPNPSLAFCSVNNSPAASLLPPSSFCSSPLYIYLCVRGGSVKCVRRRERETRRERASQSGFKRRWGGVIEHWYWTACSNAPAKLECLLNYTNVPSSAIVQKKTCPGKSSIVASQWGEMSAEAWGRVMCYKGW